ncbi:MAG: hypothetical protein R3F62_25250 [Planctomycetota bacterium]
MIRARRLAPRALSFLLCLFVLVQSGCTALPGLVTGAFTGAVDAPAQVYRYHRGAFDRHPEYWVFNLLLFVPLGIMTGPFAGFGKGVGIDVEWFLDHVTYEKAYTTYRDESIWRPFTIHW